jgi:hypothetical protein
MQRTTTTRHPMPFSEFPNRILPDKTDEENVQDFEKSSSRRFSEVSSSYMGEVIGLVMFSLATALFWIAWEDLTCTYVLPSRHRTSLYDEKTVSHTAIPWGARTIHGMGFGLNERLLLGKYDNNHNNHGDSIVEQLPSYNEVMLEHRQQRVPFWKQTPSPEDVPVAIHILTQSLTKVWELQTMALDYQWNEIRLQLHASPLSALSEAVATLRQIVTGIEEKEVIGFDWGSCAWRHCGAIADAQESIDELDHLLGILEPNEVIFCLDIIERSLRDILAILPREIANKEDMQFYRSMPKYVSKVPEKNEDETSGIDDIYFRTLQELHIDK